MYPISLFDCRCSQRGTFAEPASVASGSVPREEPANLECSRARGTNTARVIVHGSLCSGCLSSLCLSSLGALIRDMFETAWGALSSVKPGKMYTSAQPLLGERADGMAGCRLRLSPEGFPEHCWLNVLFTVLKSRDASANFPKLA